MRSLHLLPALTIFLLGCNTIPNAHPENMGYNSRKTSINFDGVNFPVAMLGLEVYSEDPRTFLENLEHTDYPVVVRQIQSTWISADSLQSLVPLLDSNRPCAPVVYVDSSDPPPSGRSTIGLEACFIVQGYRDKFYPPELSSRRCRLSAAGAREVIAQAQQKRK